MAQKRDYYEVLGVDKNATEDQIKKAPTAIPATKKLRRNSRRLPRLTTCCTTRRSVSSTTRSDSTLPAVAVSTPSEAHQ